MRRPQVGDAVRLMHGVPHLRVPAGSLGVVQSIWFAPVATYEVECQTPGEVTNTRVLVSIEQLAPEENLLFQTDRTTPTATVDGLGPWRPPIPHG